jgi:hypothetical protein
MLFAVLWACCRAGAPSFDEVFVVSLTEHVERRKHVERTLLRGSLHFNFSNGFKVRQNIVLITALIICAHPQVHDGALSDPADEERTQQAKLGSLLSARDIEGAAGFKTDGELGCALAHAYTLHGKPTRTHLKLSQVHCLRIHL